MTLGIGGHHRPNRGASSRWITPQHILRALGDFDLDPCADMEQPWPCAKIAYTAEDNGLSLPWFGRVWLNPPYGATVTGPWLAKLADHGKGTALIFARTETEMFRRYVWGRASALLFLYDRITFCLPSGEPAPHNGGAPSVLVAYGGEDASILRNECQLPGAYVSAWRP